MLIKGYIIIKIKNCLVKTISNVFYVYDLKRNLLTTRQLKKKRLYNNHTKSVACEIYDPCKETIIIVLTILLELVTI